MPNSVDANYRFIAAYQEVNARIVQRQQALALYVTLTVSLLAALVALGTSTKAATAPVEWLVLGFPVSSLTLALLNYTSERAISNLRTFLSTLERLNNAHETLPSYNTDPRWATGANKARRFRDLATLLLAIAGNVIGFGAAWQIYPQRLAEFKVFLVIGVALALTSVFILLATRRWSYEPSPA
ncbi:MAG: hypothetical protein EBS05_08475 [Proteobacteria bacterium]|jgi:hypothetical protein|nr:hypothetical protein [Pseudomonadota bacterium]NDE99836.1 hypothetical protein [Verrucomicrobiota bacterium]